MPDPRIQQAARLLIHYSTSIRPRDHVAIFASPEAEPLVAEVFREVLRAGGYPYVLMGLDTRPELGGFDDIFYAEANADQLQHVSRINRMVRSEFEAMVFVRSQRNTRILTAVDPKRVASFAHAQREVFKVFLERTARGEFKWVSTLYPTQAHAQDAAMSLSEFEDYVFGSMYLDDPDPVARWQDTREEQQRLVDWLAGKRRVELKGPNVDLRLSIDGRIFMNSCGHLNMPDGEIYTGPVEDSAEGWVRFTYPAVHDGVEVDGVELRFEAGRAIHATATKNQEFLLSTLDTDAGARYLGEWAIGNNPRLDRFIKNILFDEKLGGSFHMALGAGYPETGSKNQSAIHWDMICDMRQGGQIFVDGELFYESGRFQV
jgi:aminopeptidase